MDYRVQTETLEDEASQEQIYRDVLIYILKKCFSEVLSNEQSRDISESVDRGTS